MKHMFLEKFFPASRTTTIVKEICGIREHSKETLNEYWERFNKLCATCMTMMDQSMIDTTSGGALMDKMVAAARHLISNMTSNTQYTGSSRIRVGSLIINMESSHFGQGRVKGHMRLSNLDLSRMYLKLKAAPLFQQQQQQRMPPQGNSPSLEELMKQLTTSNLEFQQNMNSISAKHKRHHPRPQDANRTISKHREPFTVDRVRQSTLTNNSKSEGEYEHSHSKKWQRVTTNNIARRVPQEKSVPLPFPTRTPKARKPETDEELLRMFWKVEINIPLLDAIKQIPKYVKFLKELCVHNRKKMKGGVELGGSVGIDQK
ncbi:hypothetical protein CR513_56174, partial [Mucuna pruriens]